MTFQPKKVLICEDHQIVIDGLISIFKNQKDYDVIGFVKSGDQVVYAVETKHPDVLLLDINLPEINGLDILKTIKSLHKNIKVIVLTMYNKDSIVKKVKQYNGDGFLLKNCSSDDLLCAMDAVFGSSTFYTGKGVKHSIEENDGFLQKVAITQREKEIISELMLGHNVPKIAENLHISSYTVETHKKNIFRKLNIHNSIDLVTLVNEQNLLS